VKQVLPQSIVAGVTFERCVSLADYPAQTWTLVVTLRGPSVITLTGTPDGEAHQLAASDDVTATWTPGAYWYTARVTDGAVVREAGSGQTEVLPDLTAGDGIYDGRSHARKTLEAIEAVIEKRATMDQERYTINNRELWRTPIADLLKLRDTYRAEVRREEASAAGRTLWGPAVKYRF
jgi:hypothetical protein